MKNLYYLLTLLILLIAAFKLNAQEGWYHQMSGTEQPLYGIYFSDVSTGTAVGIYGTILRTTDGGKTWVEQNNGGNNSHLFDVAFINSDKGVVVGILGTILRTTDGGENWTSQTSGIVPALFSVAFADEKNGTAVGHTGIILRTTDGGITWSQLPDASTSLRAVHFVDSTSGFAVGDNGLVIHTTNAGASWIEKPSGIQINLQGVFFTDPNTGTVVGGSNLTGAKIYRTTDAGSTWILQHTIPNIALVDVYFTDPQNGTAVGWDGIIVSTKDRGASWVNETSNTTIGLNSIFFVNSEVGYAAGGIGTILTNRDGGTTHTEYETLPAEYILEQNYPNPFNPNTNIKFTLPRKSFVSLTVYNSLGEKITVIVSEELDTGTYNFEWTANGLTSGIYFYRINTESFIQTKKMILLK